MFRTADSKMTAVEIVSARYDGPIPADVLMQARAEDAAYRANPARAAAKAAVDGVEWNTRCARRTIAKIRELLAAGKNKDAIYERDWTLCAHWKARRQYQAQARQLLQEIA